MIDLHEIESTIEQLKRDGRSKNDANQLTMLYILRDHMLREKEDDTMPVQTQAYSRAADPVAVAVSAKPKSEFEQVCYEIGLDALVGIMNEHMKAIMVVHPMEYKQVLAMLNAAREE